MTREVVEFETSLARIERQRDGVGREPDARRAGLAGLSWGAVRLGAIVIRSAETVSSCWAELRSAFRALEGFASANALTSQELV